MRNELLVKLFFGLEMQREQALAHLDKQEQMLSEKLEVYHTIEENIQTHNDSEFWLYTLNYGKEIAQAELRWCQKNKGEYSMQKRISTHNDQDLVVFIIGMRINKWWNVKKLVASIYGHETDAPRAVCR
nr:hypothetical protein [Geomicrobium sp. JCM 19055]